MELSGSKIYQLLDHYFHGGQMSQTNVSTVSKDSPFFPFALEDLQYWVVKRKDGMVVKYRVVGPEDSKGAIGGQSTYNLPAVTQSYPSTPSLSGWCNHRPAKEAVWLAPNFDLFIADAPGCRMDKEEFDTVIDCGDILPLSYVRNNTSLVLDGDEDLVKTLKKYGTTPGNNARCLKIDWDDRAAPPLKFDFWPALVKKLSGTVLTACQGGHGRSGTSLVCLMMATNPEYTPGDAIIHLRAIHCPRAIESVVQHTYINDFGKWLGRDGDVERVKGVKDFKAEFLKLTHPSCKPYQERLLAVKK